jgi:AcrR family transcriptional regulator
MKSQKPARLIGRPRSFDVDKAIGAAMQVFWQKGYEGASLTDLTEAMGINRPSLYAAFGDKEALFRKALDRYVKEREAYVESALKEPSAREVVETLLMGAAELMGDPRHPSGCLMVQSALVCDDNSDCIRQELVSRRLATESAVRKRFDRARADGDLRKETVPADLARYVMTILQGMAVQAARGANRKELKRVVKTTMQSWSW